jgi:hypothetical protein
MVAAIIWCARIRIVRLTFVGFVLGRGNNMAHLGITAIAMRRRPRQPEVRRRGHELHFSDICSTAMAMMMRRRPMQPEMRRRGYELHFSDICSTAIGI